MKRPLRSPPHHGRSPRPTERTPPPLRSVRSGAPGALLEVLPRLGPTTAEGVQRALAEDGLPLALSSIYTALGALERRGLVRALRAPGCSTLFVRAEAAGVYLLCRRCGGVVPLTLPTAYVDALRARSAAHGWQLFEPHAVLTGRCGRCRAAASP
ncbi:transcriptional repressor [Truepera radiovictrix]|uniref:transcriptional repressor n=1 Tax=Truepera radiovictrix TaxID=332249 RepID=UPI0011D05DE9|nr:transcriptional repressor [Truepera radiovictrix]WMT57952.1 transcriptional repressor [Truepera radiovictrix]